MFDKKSNTYYSSNTTMQYITTITQKGQITLPIEFRKQLNVTPYDKVLIEISDDKKTIKIKATQDILDLAGTFVPPENKNKSVLEARKSFENNYKRT